MTPADVDGPARSFERIASNYIRAASLSMDHARWHRDLAETCAEQAASESGSAAGYLFRAAVEVAHALSGVRAILALLRERCSALQELRA